MLVTAHTWTSTGSSGALTAVEVPSPPAYSVLMLEASTLATTQSFAFQVAISSAGPWFVEGSTSIAITGAAATLRLTGPYQWMRPFLNSASTGTYTFRLLGVI